MNHSQKETIETLTYNFHQTWEVLKVIASTDYKYDKPLNFRVLKSYNHSVTKILLYIHSMECFLYRELKRASIEKDKTRIRSLGPYAAALSYIIENAHYSRVSDS